MKTRLIPTLLITAVLFCQFILAQQRGVGVTRTKPDGTKEEVQLYEGSYALVIGNSEYTTGWGRLSGVKSDIAAVRTVLQKHGFIVEIAEDLTSLAFESRIRKFINDYGYKRNNRLLIYYAGHGHTMSSVGDARQLGYLIPVDAPLPVKDELGLRQKALSMYTIQTFAKEIQAKHALFVFDSCFSGKLFATRESPGVTPFIFDKIDYPVRQFITAGNETQTVPDESVFRKAFVRGLEGEADRNNDGYVTGTELAEYLKEAVTNYTNRRQTPQYGKINDIELDRGDFVFSVGNLTSPAPQAGQFFIAKEPAPNVPEIKHAPAKSTTLKEIEQSFKSNLYDETVRLGQEYLKVNPDDKDANTFTGISFLRKGDIENALPYLQRSISLGDSIAFQLKRSKLEVIGPGGDTDDVEVLVSKEILSIKDDSKVFQINIRNLSEASMRNWENQCPYYYLKGIFLETRSNSNKRKEELKEFFFFPNSVTEKEFPNIFSDKYKTPGNECKDAGVFTTASLKLINYFRIER